MTWKKVLGWGFVALFCIAYVFKDPAGAGDKVGGLFHSAGAAMDSLIIFFNHI